MPTVPDTSDYTLGELAKYIDDRSKADLGRLMVAVTKHIPGRLGLVAANAEITRTLNPDDPEHVGLASMYAHDAGNAVEWANAVGDRLQKGVRIGTPRGPCVRVAADLIDASRYAADELARAAGDLTAEARAVLTAAARLRGVIGPGAALTDEAERELYVLVRAELATAGPGKAGDAKGGDEPEPVEVEGKKPVKKPPVSSEDANGRVDEWLRKNVVGTALDTVRAATVRKISADTGVSLGQFRNLPAWRAFKRKKDELLGAGDRSRQLTPGMFATIPDRKAVDPAAEAIARMDAETLAQLIVEQDEDAKSERSRRPCSRRS